jgi:hypothetical protein
MIPSAPVRVTKNYDGTPDQTEWKGNYMKT